MGSAASDWLARLERGDRAVVSRAQGLRRALGGIEVLVADARGRWVPAGEVHETGSGGLAGWSALGTLSTLSHGGYLIITAPMWIIAGIAAAAGESRAGLLRYPDKPLVSFRPYARFPQGLPPGFDASALGSLRTAPR